MTCNLLRCKDRLFNVKPGRHFGKPGHEHVCQSLGVLGQANVAHATLNAINNPAFPVGGNDRDARTRDDAAVFQDLAAAHDVLVNDFAAGLLFPGQRVALRGQRGQKLGIVA